MLRLFYYTKIQFFMLFTPLFSKVPRKSLPRSFSNSLEMICEQAPSLTQLLLPSYPSLILPLHG